jgi:hypothetical protein
MLDDFRYGGRVRLEGSRDEVSVGGPTIQKIG